MSGSSSSSVVLGVTGASGKLGGSIIRQLVADYTHRSLPLTNIIAFVRSTSSPVSTRALASLGVTLRVADYNDAADALRAAFAGVQSLVLVSGLDFGARIAQHARVVDAANAAGVRRVLYTSLLHGEASLLTVLKPDHVATEAELKKQQANSTGGFVYTILRNGWYTENLTDRIRGAVASGKLDGASGEGKIAAATIDDYAAAAVAVLLTPADAHQHDNATYELAGDADKAFTLAELAAEIQRQTKKRVVYTNHTEAELTSILSSQGVPPSFASVIASCDVATGQGTLFDANKQLSTLIGRPTTPFADVVKRILATNAN